MDSRSTNLIPNQLVQITTITIDIRIPRDQLRDTNPSFLLLNSITSIILLNGVNVTSLRQADIARSWEIGAVSLQSVFVDERECGHFLGDTDGVTGVASFDGVGFCAGCGGCRGRGATAAGSFRAGCSVRGWRGYGV